ncbi:MAG: hypothetical protein Q7R64_01610 [bacterium]|nr:hypothetical protein [bacterium]
MNIFEHIDKKTVGIFGVVLVSLAGALFYFLSSPSPAPEGPITVLSTSPLDATLGRDLLSALATLKSTKLDTSVFSDPVFLSLKDFSVEILPQPIGRRNPFAVFGASVSSQTSQSSLKNSLKGNTSGQTSLPPKSLPADTGGFDIN